MEGAGARDCAPEEEAAPVLKIGAAVAVEVSSHHPGVVGSCEILQPYHSPYPL